MTLYLASFLHTLCKTAEAKEASCQELPDQTRVPLTFALATKVFTSNFLRPQEMNETWSRNLSMAYQMVETLLRNAEDNRLWIGDSSKSEEADSVASLDAQSHELVEGLPLEPNDRADESRKAGNAASLDARSLESAEGLPSEPNELAEESEKAGNVASLDSQSDASG